jgi:hypothetical protein
MWSQTLGLVSTSKVLANADNLRMAIGSQFLLERKTGSSIFNELLLIDKLIIIIIKPEN